jgi:hypothetical protein
VSYATLIAELTGSTDPADIALTEQLMRDERTSLDYLTRDEFAAAVTEAQTAAGVLFVTGDLEMYCSAFELALPKWAQPE